MVDVLAEIQNLIPDNTIGSITANAMRTVTTDMYTTVESDMPFDPWNPPSAFRAKQNRTCIADYTFGTNTTTLLTSVAPITTITQLSSYFWNLLNFGLPNANANGIGTHYATEWQTYNGTTNMSMAPTYLQMQTTLAPAVVNNTELANLQLVATSTGNITISGAGSVNFTVASGLDWQAGDPINVDATANGSLCGSGTIGSYNAGTGALVVTVSVVNFVQTATTWLLTRGMIKSGVIRTKQTYLFGFFEAMLSLPPGNGFMTEFWMYPSDNTRFGGTFSENDILEQIINKVKGVDGTYSWCNTHADAIQNPLLPYYDIRNSASIQSGFSQGLLLWGHPNFDITVGFHKFQALWVPGYIAYYVDDTPFCVSAQPWKTVQGALADFAEIYLNMAVGLSSNNFAGLPDNIANFPGNLQVQYIRVWQSATEQAITSNIQLVQTYNLLIGGSEFNNSWPGNLGGSTLTLTTYQAADPDGGQRAARMTEGAGFTFHDIQQTSVSIRRAQAYTFSVCVHVGNSGVRNIQLRFADTTFVDQILAVFNPSTGALVSSTTTGAGAFTIAAASGTSLGSGWYQIWVTGTIGQNISATVSLEMFDSVGVSNFYNGDSASNILVYKPHLILGNNP